MSSGVLLGEWQRTYTTNIIIFTFQYRDTGHRWIRCRRDGRYKVKMKCTNKYKRWQRVVLASHSLPSLCNTNLSSRIHSAAMRRYFVCTWVVCFTRLCQFTSHFLTSLRLQLFVRASVIAKLIATRLFACSMMMYSPAVVEILFNFRVPYVHIHPPPLATYL